MSSSGQECQQAVCSLLDRSRLPNNRPTRHSSVCWTTIYPIHVFSSLYSAIRSPRPCIWVRHCATSRKAAGSVPEAVIRIFHWYKPFEVDSASNRNEYRAYVLVGKGVRWIGLTTLPPSYADCLKLLGASSSWDPQGLSWPAMGLL